MAKTLTDYFSGKGSIGWGEDENGLRLTWYSIQDYALYGAEEYEVWGKEDRAGLVDRISQVRKAFKEALAGEYSGYSRIEIGNIMAAVRAFLNKNLRENYASQGYFLDSFKEPDFIWDENAIKFLEFMLEEVTSKYSSKKANYFHLYGKLEGQEGQTWQSTNYDGVVISNQSPPFGRRTIFPVVSTTNGELLTERARNVIKYYNQIVSQGTVGRDESKILANLDYNKQSFRTDVMEAANKLVKGLVSDIKIPSNGSKLSTFKLKGDKGTTEETALSVLDWVVSDGRLPIFGGLELMPIKGFENMTWISRSDSFFYVNVKHDKVASAVSENVEGRVSLVRGNTISEQWNFKVNRNEKSIKSMKELSRKAVLFHYEMVDETNDFKPQEQGIPVKAFDQLNNSYFSIRADIGGWWNRTSGLSQDLDKLNNAVYALSLKLGIENAFSIVENGWGRLIDILTKTDTTLESQQEYGLENKVVKTDIQMKDEAIGSTAIVIAFQFLWWSALAEVEALASQIYLLDDGKSTSDLTPEKINKILEKAKEADSAAISKGAGDSVLEEEKLTESQIDERQVFLRQCALLLNMDKFKEAHRAEFIHGKNSYENLIHTVDTNDADTRTQIISKLTASPYEKVESFLNITPDIQAALAPKLRFFKVFNDKKNNSILKEVEFTFPRHYDPNNLRYKIDNSDRVFRGGGSGIKSFSWSFEGTTPATARNDIEAELVLFFQDFQELTKIRSGDDLFSNEGEGDKFSYIELLLLPGTQMKQYEDTGSKNSYHNHMLSFDPAEHRIRVDVGWVVRDDEMMREIIRERNLTRKVIVKDKDGNETTNEINMIKEALNHINKSYYLNMVDHTLDFTDEGSVEITINYRAYLESAAKTTNLDALLTPELAAQKITLANEYESIIANNLCENNLEFEELIRTYEAIEIEFVRKSHQSIVSRLLETNRLHYCLLNQSDINNFKKDGFFRTTPGITFSNKGLSTFDKDANGAEIKVEEVVEGEDAPEAEQVTVEVFHDSSLQNLENLDFEITRSDRFVTFFYFGDLIHVALDCLKDPFDPDKNVYSHLQKSKIILTSFNYLNHLNQLKNVNLAEIPISTEYFFEWMNQNVIKPKRKSYPLTFFIRDLCNKLIVDLLLEQCINRSPVKTLSFKTINLLAKGNGTDPFVNMEKIEDTPHVDVSKAYTQKRLPLESNIGNGSIRDAYNYIVIYPVTDVIQHEGRGDFFEDGKSGIYHFNIGQNKGIVKTMKFAKTDIQYIREARFMNHGHDGLMQLSAVYKVTLEMFGNSIFYPGMQIFIDPRGIGGEKFNPTKFRSVANSLGLGGYHLITRVNSTIGPGQYDTTVEAQFVYSGDGREGPFRSKINAAEEEKAIEDTVFRARSADNACSKITLYNQKNRIDNLEGARPVNLIDAYNAGLLDQVASGDPFAISIITELSEEDRKVIEENIAGVPTSTVTIEEADFSFEGEE